MAVPESITGKVTKAQFLAHAVDINAKETPAGAQAKADAVAATGRATYVRVKALRRRALPMPANPAPPVMASPPTLTINATPGGADLLPGSTFLSYTSPANLPVTYRGLVPFTASYFSQPSLQSALNGTATPPPFEVEFLYYGRKVEMQFGSFAANYSGFLLYVDGQPIAATSQQWAYGGNQSGLNLFDFGTTGLRRLRFVLDNQAYLRAINIEPTASIFPAEPSKAKAAVLGDSFVEGTGATRPITAFPRSLAERLGWDELFQAGEGGTGWVATGDTANGRSAYLARIAYLPTDLDHLVLYGSTNDASQTAAAVQAAATAVLNAAALRCPDATRYVVGPAVTSTGVSAGNLAVATGLSAACAAAGVTFIDPIAGAWITGTGRVGSTTGTGNADLFISPDGTHLSQAGHDYLGTRIAQAIAATYV